MVFMQNREPLIIVYRSHGKIRRMSLGRYPI